MTSPWQWVPDNIIEEDKQRQVAAKWGQLQRSGLAAEWADQQRRNFQTWWQEQQAAREQQAWSEQRASMDAPAAPVFKPTAAQGYYDQPTPEQADMARRAQSETALGTANPQFEAVANKVGEGLQAAYETFDQPAAEIAQGAQLRGETLSDKIPETLRGPAGMLGVGPGLTVAESLLRGAGRFAGEAVQGGLGQAATQARERWNATPEPFPTYKGIIEGVIGPTNLVMEGPKAVRALGRGATALGREGLQAARDVAASPLARELVQGEEGALKLSPLAKAVSSPAAGAGGAVTEAIATGDIVRTSYSGAPMEGIGTGSIKAGKRQLPGYRVRGPGGAEDFITADEAVLVRKGEPIARPEAMLPEPLPSEPLPTEGMPFEKTPILPKVGPRRPFDAIRNMPSEPLPREIPPALTEPQLGGVLPPAKRGAAGDMQPLPEREGFAGNIRLAKYPEPVQPLIKAYADLHPEVVQEARRGVRSDVQVQADAKALVESTGGDWKKLVKSWKPGQAWNAEEVAALRGTLLDKTQEVVTAQKAARGSDSSENLLRLRYALEEHKAIQDVLHGVTAEAGRALRVYRSHVTEALGSKDAVKIDQLLRMMGGRQQTEQLAEILGKVDLNNPDQVAAFVRSAMQPKMQDYLTELFYNSILSGPKTHLVNAISNTVTAMTDPIERAAAAGVDVVLSKVQGRPRERYLGEAGRSIYGMTMAAPEAARSALYTIIHGFSPSVASKLEFRPKAFTGKLGRVINIPSTALEAGDQLGRIINQRGALHAEAYRIARGDPEKIADLLLNPTPELMAAAGKVAEYRLFREPSAVADAVTGLRTKIKINLGKDETSRLQFEPLRFVIPFVQTPLNLTKYGLERSPLGFLNPQLWGNLARKDPQAADQIARAGLGSLVAAGVASYAADGKITGAAPSSSAERDRFYREGKLPYAIKIGDTWYSYQRIEPLNQALSQVATAVDALKMGDKDALSLAGLAAAGIGKNLFSQTFARGINDVMQAITEPERYGSQWIERFASSVAVPFSSATRTVAQTLDPVQRRPEGVAETIAAGVPGLSQTVPPRLNAFGETIQREGNTLNPYQAVQEKDTPLNRELSRLEYNIGFVGASISGVSLTREEQASYQRLAGQIAKANIEQEIQKASYQQVGDATKVKALDHIVADAREKARTFVELKMRERLLQKAGSR